jgi:hypothetical protein
LDIWALDIWTSGIARRSGALSLLTRICAGNGASGRRDVDDRIDDLRRKIGKIDRLACRGRRSDRQKTGEANADGSREGASFSTARGSRSR